MKITFFILAIFLLILNLGIGWIVINLNIKIEEILKEIKKMGSYYE